MLGEEISGTYMWNRFTEMYTLRKGVCLEWSGVEGGGDGGTYWKNPCSSGRLTT